MEEILDVQEGPEEPDRERRNWVREMKANKHVAGTTDAYGGKIADFISFLHRQHPDLLVQGFKLEYEALSDSSRRKRGQQMTRRSFVAEKVLAVDKERLDAKAIVHLDRVTEDIVLMWLAGFKGRGGKTTPSKSVYGIAQSALVDLYKRHGVLLPAAYYAGINDVKKGAQRQRAQQRVDGLVPMEEGKAAIPGYLYIQLADCLLKSGDVFCTLSRCAAGH